jgi:hypothetical protein
VKVNEIPKGEQMKVYRIEDSLLFKEEKRKREKDSEEKRRRTQE